MEIKACLFDLDGVLVDTAKYHFIAWRELARHLGFEFTEKDNERLKGVSRMRSLEILLEVGNIEVSNAEKEHFAAVKNEKYVELINRMTPGEILPGVESFLSDIKGFGIKTALGSASKNSPLIMEKTGLSKYFDAIVDGNIISKAKPDPEVFLKGAELLHIDPKYCIVFEDAVSGIEAALNAGMRCVGIGNADILKYATRVIPGFNQITANQFMNGFI